MMMLSGWKTYIVAALMVIASGLKAQGYLTDEQYMVLLGILNGSAWAALRAGVKKS